MLKKIDALRICAELWEWLEENPTEEKSNWGGWKKYGDMYGDCPCCEYTNRFAQSCDVCPLLFLWPNLCQSDQNSPFRLWKNSKVLEDRTKYAGIIATAARKEFEKLERKNKNAKD